MTDVSDSSTSPAGQSTPVAVDPRLLDILVCPVSRAPVELRADGRELWCRASGLAYPVRDGIPVMLAGEARELAADERESMRNKR